MVRLHCCPRATLWMLLVVTRYRQSIESELAQCNQPLCAPTESLRKEQDRCAFMHGKFLHSYTTKRSQDPSLPQSLFAWACCS